MSWLQAILYGLIMGISEFIPVSSAAQSRILQLLFGATANDPLRDLIVHISALCAFFVVWRSPLDALLSAPGKPRGRGRHSVGNAQSQFIKAAMLPMLIVMLISIYLSPKVDSVLTAVFLVVNGIILYLPERMLQGNKTARSMAAFDAWIIGGAGALCVIPGFSRIGMCISAAQMRGADRKNALNWAYILSIPAMLLFIGADIAGLIFGNGSIQLSTGLLGYLLLAVFSFAGCCLSVYFVRNFIIHRGLSIYAYYSWGSALYVFILYLL